MKVYDRRMIRASEGMRLFDWLDPSVCPFFICSMSIIRRQQCAICEAVNFRCQKCRGATPATNFEYHNVKSI